MTPLEQEIARQRAHLDQVDQHAASEIVRTYQHVAGRLNHNLGDLIARIEAARATGVEVRPGWLFAQQRYLRLIGDLQRETIDFLGHTLTIIGATQQLAIQDAVENGRRLVQLALGPAPRAAVASIRGSFDRLPALALQRFVGRASNGQPLGLLLHEIAPLAHQQVKDALAYGVAAGKHPSVIAGEVQRAADITRWRALTIARTEIIGANREAATQTFRQTGMVTSWTWQCRKDTRTCASCWAQSGSEHPVEEQMATHPNCRCTKVPRTRSWAELGFPGIPDARPVITPGPVAFDNLSEADRLVILGRAKLDAYNAGQITLADLVQHTRSSRWGAGSRVKSLRAALA